MEQEDVRIPFDRLCHAVGEVLQALQAEAVAGAEGILSKFPSLLYGKPVFYRV